MDRQGLLTVVAAILLALITLYGLRPTASTRAMTTSPSQEQALPSHDRSKQAFLSSLPPWLLLLATLNGHLTVELNVQRYAIEQRL